MISFAGEFRKKIDGKGRILFPAPFRDEVVRSKFPTGFYLRRHLDRPCIEGLTQERYEEDGAMVRALPRYSEERQPLEVALLNSAQKMEWDKDGRIILPERLIRHAGLGDQVLLTGNFDGFEIWNPETYDQVQEAMWEKAQSVKHLIGGQPLPTASSGDAG